MKSVSPGKKREKLSVSLPMEKEEHMNGILYNVYIFKIKLI